LTEQGSPERFSLSTATLPVLVQRGDDARRRQLWEIAIESYQAALKLSPNDSTLHLVLGQSLEGKSRDKDGGAYVHLAMEQYRQALRQNPASTAAHDALLAAATKTRQLAEILDEYKARMEKDPQNPAWREGVKKIQTLMLLDTTQTTAGKEGSSKTLDFFLNKALPFGTFFCFLGYVIAQAMKSRPLIHGLALPLKRMFLFMLAVYVVHIVVRIMRRGGR